jgi:hypothetical protein
VDAGVDKESDDFFGLGYQLACCCSERWKCRAECVEWCVAISIEAVNRCAAMKEQLHCVETWKFADIACVKIIHWRHSVASQVNHCLAIPEFDFHSVHLKHHSVEFFKTFRCDFDAAISHQLCGDCEEVETAKEREILS